MYLPPEVVSFLTTKMGNNLLLLTVCAMCFTYDSKWQACDTLTSLLSAGT